MTIEGRGLSRTERARIAAKAGIQDSGRAFAGTAGVCRALCLATLVAAFGLSGCGREGPLELPPGPAPSASAPSAQLRLPDGSPAPGSPQDAAAKNGFDAQGNPVATPSRNRSFVLDPLLQ